MEVWYGGIILHNGRIILMAIFLAVLIVIMPVSAEDANSTDIALADEMASGNDLQITQDDALSATHTVAGNTFDDIQNAIDNAREGDTIELSGNYTGNGTEIKIDKSLNIQGNAILDANKKSSVFCISSEKTTNIIDLSILNSNDTAVYSFKPDSLVCLNCTFINNSARYGGAIKFGTAVDCTFINNTVSSNGGAMQDADAVNCTFINNYAGYNGGAIFHGNAVNCTFINNSVWNDGGGIAFGDAANSTFINNTAARGGAIAFGDALRCIFINNSDENDNEGWEYFYKGGDTVYLGTAAYCYFEGNRKPFKYIDLENESSGESFEILKNSTFSALGNMIFFSPDGATIYLDKDYYLDEDYYNAGTANTNGLSIRKSLTINGNGHVIDGRSVSDLDISSYGDGNVIFNNITFRNFVSYRAFASYRIRGMPVARCAISLYDLNCSFVNCNFINIKARTENDCAFLSVDADNSSFINCSFINCSSNNHGGALTLVNTKNSSIINCSFINCSSILSAGAVWMEDIGISSIVNSSFINNSATYSGGAILIYGANESSIVNCSFEGNHAQNPDLTGRVVDILIDDSGEYLRMDVGSFGGAIFLQDIDVSLIDSCSFNNNLASGGAGAVYLLGLEDSQVISTEFSNNYAFHGGTVLCEYSDVSFINMSVSNSSSYRFGGAVASLSSRITLDNCSFNTYQSLSGAGGAVYNSNGSAKVINSSFANGLGSLYGGAIANSQSNLTILSCEFTNNTSENGGAVYGVHGNIHVSDSLFINSRSSQGSAFYCMLSNTLTFTNNIFINSTGNHYIIYSIYSNNPIVDEANHFENIYHVKVEYNGVSDDGQFTVKSKTLNYIVSNTGKFLNTYENLNSSGDDSKLVTVNLFDSDYPNSSTIFDDFNATFNTKLYFQRNYDLNAELKDYEVLNVYLYDDGAPNASPEKIQDIGESFQLSMDLSFANRTIFEYNDLIGFNGHEVPISLINSSKADLANIPSSYDSRDYGYITPVRNQGSAGNCWAFSALATLETCIKKATGLIYDFSENNPKNLMAMDSAVGMNMETNRGGYDSVVMGYLNSWLGPISERSDAYDAYSSLSPVFPSIFHIQNIYFLPARQNNLDNALFKKAIMDYGAVSVSLKWSDNLYHAVSLIGWVDKYDDYDSLGNYAKHAWIFKNSWGSSWEDNGIGYLTFDIPFLSDDVYSPYHAYTFVFDKYESYYKSYQQEYSGVTDYLTVEGDVYYQNRFVCNENPDYDEGLVAFATYFKYPTNYTVSVYVNDELVLSQEGYSLAGYYTIPLAEAIDLKKDDEFTIMVHNRNDELNFVPVCQSDETTVANAKPNASLVSFDGVKWFDLYDLEGPSEYLYEAELLSHTCQVACIKAFTSLYNARAAQLDVAKFDKIDINQTVTIDLSVQGNQFYFDTIEVTNNTLITININGKYYYAKINDGEASVDVSFDNGGDYKLSARYENNLFSSNEVQFNFTVNRQDTVLSVKSVSKIYGTSKKAIATLTDADGNPLEDAVITVTLNGKSADYKTNSKGKVIIPIKLAPKSYTATLSYAGNGLYDGANAKVKIVVKKAKPKMTAAKKTFKLKTKTKKYTVSLKNNLGKAMKGKKVKLTVNGKTYTAKTNAKGKATFKITKLNRKGSFKATIKYAGSKYYKKVTKKVKLTVKK